MTHLLKGFGLLPWSNPLLGWLFAFLQRRLASVTAQQLGWTPIAGRRHLARGSTSQRRSLRRDASDFAGVDPTAITGFENHSKCSNLSLHVASKKVWHTEDSGSWARQCWLVENSEDGLYRNPDNNTVTGSCGSKGENRGVEYLLSSTEGPGPGLACASLMLDDDSRLSASCSLSNQDNRILGQKADRISSVGHNRLWSVRMSRFWGGLRAVSLQTGVLCSDGEEVHPVICPLPWTRGPSSGGSTQLDIIFEPNND